MAEFYVTWYIFVNAYVFDFWLVICCYYYRRKISVAVAFFMKKFFDLKNAILYFGCTAFFANWFLQIYPFAKLSENYRIIFFAIICGCDWITFD